MAYLVGLCASLILAAAAVSASSDIFDFDIPDNTTGATNVIALRNTAEENLCAYVGLNCDNNTDTTRPANLTKDSVIQDIVDMLESVEEYFHTEDYGFERYNSTHGRKVLELFLDSPKTKELIRIRSQPCFSSINQKFVNIIHQHNISQDFNNFITSSPFDDQHCITALKFNNLIQTSPDNITGCDNHTLSIVYDVFEDVRVHLNNCSLPKPEPEVPTSTTSNGSIMILGSIPAILLSLILVKIY